MKVVRPCVCVCLECVLVGGSEAGALVTRLAGSIELRVSARHASRETGAHLQSP